MSAAKATLATTPLGQVVSRDPRGAGRFVVSPTRANAARLNLGHETAARLHFERHATALGLDDKTARGAIFKAWQSLPQGGGIAQFEQRVDNIEVFRARASVVVDGSNQLVSIGNSFPATAKAWTSAKNFKTSAESAIASAYTVHAGLPLAAQSVRDEGEVAGSTMRNYAVETPAGGLQVLTATAKKVFFPVGDRLEAAYYVEIEGRTAARRNDARGFVVAADDGRILQQESLTHEDAFKYRVWASATAGNNIPDDGPNVDDTPHHSGTPDGRPQTYSMPNLVEMEGFNKNPAGAADPWLPADATTTWGNNVRAYSDRNQGTNEAGAPINDGYQDGSAPDGAPGDLIADTTAAKTFDRTYDINAAPNASANQVKAAITQLFYVNNWLHDYWYDSGFNELAGNAQTDNFMRGGVGNDPIRAEAQDSADNGQSNNANMNTMADGTPPRMQMYVWSGLAKRTLVIPGVTISDPLGAAGFGPQVFDVMAPGLGLVVANDGDTTIPPGGTGTVGTTSDGCTAIPNVMGKIAIIDRGQCGFVVKVQNAQTGGATGVLLVNNVAGNAAPSPGGVLATSVPLLGVSQEDGVKIKAALAANPALAAMTFKRELEIQRDGTIDNTIVAHEWGHFWHHRLVQCGSTSCGGMSEGWGDLQAVLMAIRDGDTFDGGKTYAMSQYAAQGISKDGSYFGIRRAPYSKDKLKNPFTFGHIRAMATVPTGVPLAPAGAEMNEVHNVGEIWTQTLFESYTNLIETLKAATPPVPFEQIKRRFADYLVAGMKATPTEPTFVEQRDAILAAVLATGRMDDFSAIAQGCAKRGLGVGAVAPPSTSTTLNEAVENFDFKGASGFVEAKIDDSAMSCDKDGNLDVNETGKLTVKVKNTGWVKLTKTLVKATSTEPNLTFSTPTTMLELNPYEEKTVTIDVSAKMGVAQKKVVPIVVSITDADAVKDTVDTTIQALVNFDEAKGSSKTDDVESLLPPVWTMEHSDPMSKEEVWTREGDPMAGHVWHGAALAAAGSEALVSPPLTVSATENLTIGFKHAYAFEVGTSPIGGGMANFDGAVLEIMEGSGDASTGTWVDVSTYADPMYPVTIFTGAPSIPDGNPLAGKKAWGGRSPMYPALVPFSIDLGTKLAGKTIRVRFRIGTDDGTGAAGWNIDDIAFGGITNSPFSKIADNSGVCSGDGGTPTDGGRADGSAGAGGSTGGSGGSGG
ncbi:MAG: M36 family metallopeptidase, partial [Polyangiaceae bacterium]